MPSFSQYALPSDTTSQVGSDAVSRVTVTGELPTPTVPLTPKIRRPQRLLLL